MIYQGCSIPELTENALPSCSGIVLDQPLRFLPLADIVCGRTATKRVTTFTMYVGFSTSE